MLKIYVRTKCCSSAQLVSFKIFFMHNIPHLRGSIWLLNNHAFIFYRNVVEDQTDMKLELLNLITQLNITLEDYQSRRQVMSERKRKWSYFIIFFTGFLTLPFFGSLFRNIDLTKAKNRLVANTQIKNRNLLIMLRQEKSPSIREYLDTINDNLANVHASNNLLHEKYKKMHLSKQQLESGASTAKPSFFQSGLTLAIERCFKQLNDFRNKYVCARPLPPRKCIRN
jgi:hypothetical protein